MPDYPKITDMPPGPWEHDPLAILVYANQRFIQQFPLIYGDDPITRRLRVSFTDLCYATGCALNLLKGIYPSMPSVLHPEFDTFPPSWHELQAEPK